MYEYIRVPPSPPPPPLLRSYLRQEQEQGWNFMRLKENYHIHATKYWLQKIMLWSCMQYRMKYFRS